MVTKNAMHLKTALAYAERVVELLAPHCEKIDVAGSIRRQKKIVGDIEIVCQPKKETINTDLFNSEYRTVKSFDLAVEAMAFKIVKGNSAGRHMQIILKGGAQLDLFMPQVQDYYRQLAIRTGSSYYVQKVIAAGWRKKGWVGVSGLGLRRECDCTSRRGFGKDVWSVSRDVAFVEEPPAWESEKAFFDWLGVEYLAPHLRETYSEYQYLAK
ncbi:hypothetical protein ACTJIJ_19755 [Niabella sp. 22666]|uniref:hypothetical protein n=1 Tax=Niabella sp. 22666 TaxID=3453954 RepID=UPI003F86938B